MRAALLALIVALPALAGCLGAGTPPPSADAPPDEGERHGMWRTLDRGQFTGLDAPLQEVVVDETRWAQLWEKHHAISSSSPPPPPVDFAREHVVVFVLAEKGSGCWHVTIENMTERGARLEVPVTVHRPAEGTACAAVMVKPFHFVAVETRATQAEFAEHEALLPPPRQEPQVSEVEFLETRDLARGGYSGVQGPREAAFMDEDAWIEFWQEHASGYHEPPAPPEVDFGHEVVLAIVLEPKPSSGYDVTIRRVTWDGHTLVVEYLVGAPTNATEITEPHHFVTVTPTGEVHAVRFVRVGGSVDGEDGDVTWRTLDRGLHTGLDAPLQELVTDEARWSAVWEAHNKFRSHPAPLPAVDFSREHVLVFVLTQRGDGCWHITIENMTQRGARLEVPVSLHAPAPEDVCGAVKPFHFVAVETRATQAEFELHETSRPRPPLPAPPQATGAVLEIRELASGNSSRIDERREAFLPDEDAWQAFWQEHNRMNPAEPPAEPPAVDFSREVVLAVVLEPQSTPGHHPVIDRVVFESGTLHVEYRWAGWPTDMTAMAYPFHFVAVAPGDDVLSVRFVDVGRRPNPVPFETLAQGQSSGADTPTRRVMTDQDDWSAFWAQHARDPEPQVDFEEERVVAVVLEQKGNSCWRVEITAVDRESGKIVVEVTTVEPGPRAGCYTVMVKPFHFVAIPAGAEPVVFTDRTRVEPGEDASPTPP